VRFSNFAKA